MNMEMENELYVEDIIVPLLAIPRNNPNKFRFLGTGFYIDSKGHLITCNHVISSLLENEKIISYQLGIKQETEIEIIHISSKYDIALCKSISPPSINIFWPFIDETLINLGSEVEVYGYVNEPIGPEKLPFRQRYLRGYITGISRDDNYPDSFELSFPVLFGMSGSPLICHLKFEGVEKRQTGIVGCAYGSRESEIVHHTVVESDDYKEKVSKIVELGMALNPQAIFSIFKNTDVDIYVHTEKEIPLKS
ncbi:MAG: trypsin-like peptidase domain-containing protein [Deltaproteobacteria bacterium]|nr:trypsin-like peptidase domain-containing protein [Deltaproteobacteria bacterium]